LDTQKEELNELRIQQQSSKAFLDQFVKHNTELQNQVYKAEKDIAILNIQKEALLQESRRNIEDTASKETELNEFNKAVAELESKLKIRQETYLQTQQHEEELTQQLTEIEQLL